VSDGNPFLAALVAGHGHVEVLRGEDGRFVYRTSPVKPPGSGPVKPPVRRRSTKDEVERRRRALLAIVAAGQPMSVRQVYYQATVHGIVEKTELGYRRVQEDLVHLRRIGGEMPRHWIADSTRWQRKPRTFDSVEAALRNTAETYRKALWTRAGSYVELWLEKDALAGVVLPVTSLFDVPLMVVRGYASLSFLSAAAEAIAGQERPAYIFHLGDFDPSGVDAGRAIEARLREYAPGAEIHFERLAVTPEQIEAWRLPTRPTKTTDSRARGFGAVSVELDAIPPHVLRARVKDAIEQHLPRQQLEVLQAAEDSEREFFVELARTLFDGGDL
jgi:hypothetical protein